MKARKLDKRKVKERILIICEGEKTEPIYFNGIKNEKRVNNHLAALKIELHDSKINTGKQLVELAKELKKAAQKELNPYDEVWVVFDKDGYTKHPETFNQAKDNGIKVAFSSVSFEYWFLLHLVQTTKQFKKADDLIKELKTRGYHNYDKNLDHYEFLKLFTDKAINNAQWLREQLESTNDKDYKCYECDAYTDVDILVEYLLNLK